MSSLYYLTNIQGPIQPTTNENAQLHIKGKTMFSALYE